MKNCVDCNFMRVKIPIIDGVRDTGMIAYRNGIARCERGVFGEKKFRLFHKNFNRKTWDEAEVCEFYKNDDNEVSHEIASVIVQAYRIVHGK